MKTVGLIMAGGSGTRFWPLSRTKTPKQVLKLTGDKEMINATIDRCVPFIDNEDMHIITNQEQSSLLKAVTQNRMDDVRIFKEPSARNTAPCILYSAFKLRKKYGEAVLCVLSADHSIKDEPGFQKVLSIASVYAANHDAIVTIGIVPTFPSTGYGYIQMGLESQTPAIHHVERFVEKPDIYTATEYMQSGQYLWNSGMFLFRISTILNRYQECLPDMYKALEPLENLQLDQEEAFIKNVYPTLERISFDYGIMEKERSIAVIPGDFGWSDIGTWDSLGDILPSDSNGNIIKGDHIGLDTKDCVIFSEGQTVTTIGVSNIVIVSTPDGLLVCSLDQVQNIKQLTEELKKRGREDLL